MFVDSDDEWEEQTDSYEYRPELVPVSKPLEQDDNIYFLPIVEVCKEILFVFLF